MASKIDRINCLGFEGTWTGISVFIHPVGSVSEAEPCGVAMSWPGGQTGCRKVKSFHRVCLTFIGFGQRLR